MTATAVDERSPLPGPTWPPSAPPTSFPLADRPVVLADDPCEAGFSGAGPEYAGMYLHARYFDPKLGTFLSPDPIGVAGGMNLYAYALGNPVNGTDRSGLNTCPTGLAPVASHAGLTTATATGAGVAAAGPAASAAATGVGQELQIGGKLAAEVYEGIGGKLADPNMVSYLSRQPTIPWTKFLGIVRPLISVAGIVVGALFESGCSPGPEGMRLIEERFSMAPVPSHGPRPPKPSATDESKPNDSKPDDTAPTDNKPTTPPCRGRGCLDSPYVHPDPTRGGPNYWNPFDYWNRYFNPYNPWEGVPTKVPPMQCFSDNPKDCIVINPN